MLALGPAIGTLGLGFMSFASPLALAGIGVFSLATWQLSRLAKKAQPISILAGAIKILAESVKILTTNLGDLDTDKLQDIGGIAVKSTKTLAAGEIKAANRVVAVAKSPRNLSESQDSTVAVVLDRVEKLLTSINNKVSPSYDVYLDTDKVGQSLAVNVPVGFNR